MRNQDSNDIISLAARPFPRCWPRGFATRPHSGQQRGEGLAASLWYNVIDISIQCLHC